MILSSQEAVRNKKDSSIFAEQRILPLLGPHCIDHSSLLDLFFVLPIPFPRSLPSVYSHVSPILKKLAHFLPYPPSEHLISLFLFRMAFCLLTASLHQGPCEIQETLFCPHLNDLTVTLPPLVFLEVVSSFSWVMQR